jgi:hypothetical protein
MSYAPFVKLELDMTTDNFYIERPLFPKPPGACRILIPTASSAFDLINQNQFI